MAQLPRVADRENMPITRAVAASAVVVVALSACGASSADKPLTSLADLPRQAQPGTQAADGAIPDGQSISPFDGTNPAIAKLDPDLRRAMQDAAEDASSDGISFRVDSGWRSASYQQQLLERAVFTYGSEEAARRYVSTPGKSAHVKGQAVDIGPAAADSWLAQHGTDYGLCQTYANEKWHFELSTRPGGTCPAQVADASAG